MKFIDIRGKRFGKLVAVKYLGNGMWKFRCDCGKMVQRGVTRILRKYRRLVERSCGCLLVEAKRNGAMSGRTLYLKYKYGASKRGLCFAISDPWFLNLTQQPCYYCGVLPSQKHQPRKVWGRFTYNGIDRLDNKRGYTMDNCVPCCKVCNTMKMGMGVNDLLRHMRTVLRVVNMSVPPHVRYRPV